MLSHPVLFKSIKKSEPTLLSLGSETQLRGYRADRTFIFENKELEMISIIFTASDSIQAFGYMTKDMESMKFLTDDTLAKLKIASQDIQTIKNVAEGTEQSIQKILDAITQLENIDKMDDKKSSVTGKPYS